MSAPCPICESQRYKAFAAQVLGQWTAEYLKCAACGFLSAVDPEWLDAAYSSAIADVDTGVLARVRDLEPRLITLLGMSFPAQSSFADMGAGYGILVRTMRDAGFDFRWSDPYCENLVAKGFELGSEPCAALTAIEVIEHAIDPIAFLRESLDRTSARAAIFTTELLPEPVPDPRTWWYYAFSTGQHLSFFEPRTLRAVADVLGMKLQSRRNLHVLHRGDVSRFAFLLSATRCAPMAARILKRRRRSLTESDSPLLSEHMALGEQVPD